MIQNCNEQLLDDVVRIDLVLAASCHFAVPFQKSLTEMAVENLSQWTPQSANHPVIGQALLSVAYNVQDGDDGEMDSAPSLKQSDKQVTSGIVVSHDLQIPVTAGFEATKIAVQSLQTRHFHAILTTQDGTRYLFLMNFSSEPATVAIGPGCTDLLTGKPAPETLQLKGLQGATLCK